MPIAGSFDLYDAAYHHGLFSSSFVAPFLSLVGMTSNHTDKLWRSTLVDAVRKILLTPAIHKKFATMNGEAALAGLKLLVKLHHDPHPWDEFWQAMAVEHPSRDAWWDERTIVPLLKNVEIPVYLGCDWQNVPMHLPATFPAFEALSNSKHVRVAMLGDFGLTWPWESLHVEVLAWYDHWLKGRDTGVLDGPRIRYVLPEADGWRAADAWPPPGMTYTSLALRGDGRLATDEGATGKRTLMTLGAGLNRSGPSVIDPPADLSWETEPLERDLDVAGDIELVLDAESTAPDTAWIATLQDVAADGTVADVTAGYLRASLRDVDEAESRLGAPVLDCRTFRPVPIGELTHYRIPLVANARRFKAGHRLRLFLTSDDQNPAMPAIMSFRHASVGTSSMNAIHSSSRFLLPVIPTS
jgi:predicted acyl esterase